MRVSKRLTKLGNLSSLLSDALDLRYFADLKSIELHIFELLSDGLLHSNAAVSEKIATVNYLFSFIF